MKQIEQKLGRVTQVLAIILFIALFVSAVCFYATIQKFFFFRALQVIAAMFAIAFAIDSIAGFAALTRAASRDRNAIARLSTNILGFAFLALFVAASLMGFIPPRHLPWILPVTVIALPFLLVMGHGPLMERDTSAVFRFLVGALIAGGLTWGQLALVEHFDTWLFLKIGFIPVPLLGITVLITGVATVFCVLVTTCAVVFHTLRVAYHVG